MDDTKDNAPLGPLLRPRSVAIVGASADPARVSGRVLHLLRERGFGGAIHPVNPNRDEIAGLRCARSVDAVEEAVDVAVVALPARAVPETVAALARRGVPAAVVLGSGFSEIGPEGAALERKVVEIARRGGPAGPLRLLGPNTLGLVNAFDRVALTFGQYAEGETPPGPVGLVSQSGAFGGAIAALARRRGFPVGYCVATGNEADLGFAEAMEAVLADPRVAVGAGYVEGLRDGAAFLALAGRALAAGKPLAIVKAGRSRAGARAAASHTGALAGEDAVFDGVARQFGVVRARDEAHLLDLAEALARCAPPAGPNLGVVTMSGGAGILIADRAEELGLRVPDLAPATQEALTGVLAAFGATGNPVDVTGQFVSEPDLMRDALIPVLRDPGIDVGVAWLQMMDGHVERLVEGFRAVRAAVDKPFIVAWVAAPPGAERRLREAGIAVLAGAEPAVDAIAGLVAHAAVRRAPPMAATATAAAPDAAALELSSAPGGAVPTVEARAILERFGVRTARAELARSAEEAAAAAARLGWPVVAKIESPDILHKTEVGGVRLGLRDEAGLRTAFEGLLADAARHRPGARLEGVVVQETGRGTVELVVGLQNDPVFGPVVMVGLGGTLVEVLRDVAFRKAPVSPAEARAMLDELKGARVLDGVRGAPPVDREALADLVAAASRLGAAAGPRLRELDLNPVLAGPDGAVAVDWLLMLDGRTPQ